MPIITEAKAGACRKILPLLIFSCGLITGITQADTAIPAGWRLSMDNDAIAPNNNDHDYTGGISFTYSSATSATGLSHPPRISLDAVIGFIGQALDRPGETPRRTFYATEAGMSVFTPEDTQRHAAVYDDRPYASLLFLSSSRQTLSANDRQAITQTFTVGALGLVVSADVQNALHRQFGIPTAKGWDYQISADGEPTLRYSRSRQTLHWARKGTHGLDYDLSSTIKGNLGYLTDLGWGISGRLGRINSPWWSHNPLLEEYAERGTAHATRGASRRQFYLWGGLFVRARVYNALLQGQFRDNAVDYSGAQLKPLIATAWLGLDYVLAGNIRLSYSWHGQTSEIRRGRGNRFMNWGTLSIAGNF